MHKHTSARFLVALSTILSTLVLARSASAETIDLIWDPNPEPQVVGYVVHVGTQPGAYTQHIDVGPTTTWSFTSAVAGQQYCFAVTAYITGSLEGPRSNEACGFSNAPPALVNPGTQSSMVGQAASLQLAGTDPEGDPLTYSATGLPPGLTVMASTGYISGTPTTAGSYTVNARASDSVLTASQTFTWTVGIVDTVAPVVTITGPTTAATFTTTTATLPLSGTASDNIGVTQVSWVSNRGGSGTTTGTTGWSASVVLLSGSNLVTVTANDAAGNTSTDVLTVTYNAPNTTAPVVTITSPTTASTFATTKSTVTLKGSASDNVGVTQVTWRNDRGGSGTATGTTSWSATGVALQQGVNVLTVTARDAAGNTSADVLAVTYTPPLRITSLTADRPAPQPLGTTVTFTAVSTGDRGPYEYQWRVYDGAKWVTASPWSTSNQFVWKPTKATSLYQVRAVVRSSTLKTAMTTMPFVIVP